MIKRLLIIALCLIAFRADAMMLIGGKVIAAVCAESYAPSVTQDQGDYVGYGDNLDFTGFIYKPTDTECVCEIYPTIREEVGDPTGNNYHIRIFTIDGNDDVDAIIGTSAAVAGATIQGAGNGAEIGPFIFSPCVTLTGGTEYAITAFIDTDSNLTDDPSEELDASNYWRWAYDDERSLDAIQMGRAVWTWDAAIPYENTAAIDAEDDGDFRVFTQ